MQGCGNDYVYINCFDENNRKNINDPGNLARIISNRHYGIGSDGLILIEPAKNKNADAFMNMFNADGSQGNMCGNGIRCVAKYIYDHGLIDKSKSKNFVNIDTRAGIKNIKLEIENEKVKLATVNMGQAEITSDIPENILIQDLNLKFIGVNTGNPHAVYFFDDNEILKEIDYISLGKYFENHKRFLPERVNSEFIKILSRNEINMRVYERGSGETLACGTGAVASAFAGYVSGKLNNEVIVHLRGGDLKIKIMPDNHCYMTGPAVEVFNGEFDFNL